MTSFCKKLIQMDLNRLQSNAVLITHLIFFMVQRLPTAHSQTQIQFETNKTKHTKTFLH